MKALVIYYSKTGHTFQAANDIGKGLAESGVDVTVRPAVEVGASDIAGFDVLLVGSPTYGSTMYRAPAKVVDRVLDSLKPSGLSGKYAGAFSAMAAFGGEKVVEAMEGKLSALGATVVVGGPAVKAGAPLSLWVGPNAGAADVEACVEFGRRVAKTAGR